MIISSQLNFYNFLSYKLTNLKTNQNNSLSSDDEGDITEGDEDIYEEDFKIPCCICYDKFEEMVMDYMGDCDCFSYCTDCLQEYIKASMNQGKTEILCMKCDEELS